VLCHLLVLPVIRFSDQNNQNVCFGDLCFYKSLFTVFFQFLVGSIVGSRSIVNKCLPPFLMYGSTNALC
jgi:hypothetical protein